MQSIGFIAFYTPHLPAGSPAMILSLEKYFTWRQSKAVPKNLWTLLLREISPERIIGAITEQDTSHYKAAAI